MQVLCYLKLLAIIIRLFNIRVCLSYNELLSNDCKYELLPSQVDIQLLRDPGGSACLALKRIRTDPKKTKLSS